MIDRLDLAAVEAPQPEKSGEGWIRQLANVITDPNELLQLLGLEESWLGEGEGVAARRLFPMRVPRAFVRRMRHGDPGDPLLHQVMTMQEEFLEPVGFTDDPLVEHRQVSPVPGILHKYQNRLLLMVKGGCAVNCRYCFRRHFPYEQHPGNKKVWQVALNYIRTHPELDEVILSGGDPLMARDAELEWLVAQLENIPHLRRLRIHTRLPVVIPARVTRELCRLLASSPFQIVLVTHINHGNEIDEELRHGTAQLRAAGVTLLNQGVLLKGVNNSVEALLQLSIELFNAGILPYYLHVLDRVRGASHFLVGDEEAKGLVRGLMQQTSGYLVPRLVREISGVHSKVPLDLGGTIIGE